MTQHPHDGGDHLYQRVIHDFAQMGPPIHCPHCLDGGVVCEEHPEYPWDIAVEGHRADCGPPGMPCPACCAPIPEDGTHSIAEAFTPDHLRGRP